AARGGRCRTQELAGPAEAARVVTEAIAAEVGLAEPIGLEHRAHRSIEDHDPLAEDAGQGGQAGLPIEGGVAHLRPGSRRDRHDATATAGCRARIRRTSSAHCSYRPKLGMMYVPATSPSISARRRSAISIPTSDPRSPAARIAARDPSGIVIPGTSL